MCTTQSFHSCNCPDHPSLRAAQVAVLVFAPGDGALASYSSSPMDELLRRFGDACARPHEAHTTQDVRGRCPAAWLPQLVG